jgi:hypothetical protein
MDTATGIIAARSEAARRKGAFLCPFVPCRIDMVTLYKSACRK